MHIQSIENELLLNQHPIITVKVRGKKEELDHLMSDIQDHFDLAHDEWTPELAMLTMTFDYKKGEQTLTQIKRFIKGYIENN